MVIVDNRRGKGNKSIGKWHVISVVICSGQLHTRRSLLNVHITRIRPDNDCHHTTTTRTSSGNGCQQRPSR